MATAEAFISSKQYTDEFRAEAVKQVLERGFAVVDVATRIGIPKHTLYGWVQKARKGRGQAHGGTTVDHDAAEMRRLTATVSGAPSDAVAVCRHSSGSDGNRPCARHQALLSASLIAAVAITASSRATGVQPPLLRPDASASARQRSSVPADTPTSRATTSGSALSGGNSRATALSLNACPYRANVLSSAPDRGFYRGDNYLDAGGTLQQQLERIQQLPNARQRIVNEVLDSLLALAQAGR